MADDMCGPSNAAKSLARHLEHNRSLHDRYAAHPAPQHAAQAFRNSPLGSNTSNQQFSAFQSTNATLADSRFDSRGIPIAPSIPRPADLGLLGPTMQAQHLGNPASRGRNWATDFSQMDLPSRLGQMNLNGGFSQATQNHSLSQMPPRGISGHAYRTRPVDDYSGLHYADLGPVRMAYRLGSQQTAMPQPIFNQTSIRISDDFDFEKEFLTWMATNSSEAEPKTAPDSPFVQHNHSTEQQTSIPTDAHQVAEQNSAPLERSTVPQTEQATTTLPEETAALDTETQAGTQRADDLELAIAAQQILDSVADNQNDKFKSSDFLQMMRKIASQDLVVRDNSLVESSQAPTTESEYGSHATGQTSAASPPPSSMVAPKPATVEDALSSEWI
ncbi:hypothetical protein F4677DRAFT_405995 [Hypoxylon crocopeplum]|nr:hypothetical protein F4677DRAFT_405995 [Hypoxylon crocopeplum]